MQDKIYIHYGHATFDPSLFKPIQNEQCWVKPRGGLWASSIDAKLGWKDWCEREEFRECIEENSFRFTLPEANIFVIDSVEKLKDLPTISDSIWEPISTLIDFEKCIELGYDAIELSLSTDRRLYWQLYGWDCDSILVMNPDKIKIETSTQVTANNDIFVIATKTCPLMERKKGDILMNGKTVLKTIGKIAGVAATVYVALSGVIDDQKKEKEFKNMQKDIADLKKQNGENP